MTSDNGPVISVYLKYNGPLQWVNWKSVDRVRILTRSVQDVKIGSDIRSDSSFAWHLAFRRNYESWCHMLRQAWYAKASSMSILPIAHCERVKSSLSLHLSLVTSRYKLNILVWILKPRINRSLLRYLRTQLAFKWDRVNWKTECHFAHKFNL